MSVLQIADIKSSIQAGLIKDGYLKQGQFEFDNRGRLISYTGGFTVVVPIKVQGMKWALRCWYMDLGNVRKRMEVLANYLQKQSLPYFCDFSYVDEGILVDGKIYPITRMKWIDGERLDKYICSHRNKLSLLGLAENFLSMCKELHKHKISHGDLQHGNIMVDLSGNIFLIDYDSMYVPTMKGESDIIAGLKDYQHPKRKNNLYASETLDYFSELIIYISILAVAENPNLIDKYQIGDAEHLLFTSDDFTNLKNAAIYNDIYSLGGIFPLLLLILEEYLSKKDINELEPFDVLLDRYTLEPVIKSFSLVNNANIVYRNSQLTLCWEVENYNCILLNGKICNGFKYVDKIKSDTIYTLEVINGLKNAIEKVSVKVVDEPVIKFKLASNKLRKNSSEKTTLKWNIQNAISAKLIVDGEERIVDVSGNEEVAPTKTMVYEIQVVGLDGVTIFKKQVTLYVLSDTQIEFKTNRLYTYSKIPFVLSWDVQHAKSIELVGYGKVEESGSKIIEIEHDTTFILKVIGSFGVKTEEILVKTLPLPVIKTLLVPAPEIKHQTTVNLNLTQIQPMVSMPTNLYTHISIPSLVEPDFAKLEVEMHKTPKFHSLNINLKSINWWNNIWSRIRSIKGFKF